jgi:hypothetical protein
MAEQPSEKSPYKSRYGGGYISIPQYIAEVVCQKIAFNKNQELPQKFWDLPEWKRTFLLQIRHANSLLKIYHPRAIVQALRDERASWIYSLGVKNLDAIILEYQNRLVKSQETGIIVQPGSTNSQPQKEIPAKKSLRAKLEALD